MKAKHIISILFLSFLLGIASGCCQTQELKREASSNDKRSMLISLTQEGKDLIENCMIEVAKQKEKKFSILTQKEKEDLKNILSKITYSFI